MFNNNKIAEGIEAVCCSLLGLILVVPVIAFVFLILLIMAPIVLVYSICDWLGRH